MDDSNLSQAKAQENAIRANFRSAMLQVIGPAIARLARIASGDSSADFKTEHEMRACMMLAKLGPRLVAYRKADDDNFPMPKRSPIRLDITDEQKREFIDYLDGKAPRPDFLPPLPEEDEQQHERQDEQETENA